MATPFDRLHPALQHHIVNSLGWRSLRPLQDEAIEPILAGHHVLAVAPTAGGKTEAAFFPVLSRMLDEGWQGLTVLYLCPLRALLNNLHGRLDAYAHLVGRRVGLWHGDIGSSQRDRLLADPPDVLLTTPESLEAMLVSTRVAHDRWFRHVRTVIVDEAHAFAADDRGWHLKAVVARVARLAGRDPQRIALSATIGNPHEVLGWLTDGSSTPALVVAPPTRNPAAADLELDYVGSLANAATVVSRLHRGDKRLVFVDSRAKAEELALALRERGVTTFVSHGSLGPEERRRTEAAFAEARDCVIVATSTLELGIDVGDLDRVVQVNAPATVASFLQRLGRTGRRPGSRRNTLFLAVDEEALVRAAALGRLFAAGTVEPVTAPALPLHLVAQQCLAVSLQEGGAGRHTWHRWLGSPSALGAATEAYHEPITSHLVASGWLHDDNGIVAPGPGAEAAFGRRHFLELLSTFTSAPMLSVRHGRDEVGHVPDATLFLRPPGAGEGGASVLLLAGRPWAVLSVDWARRVVQVEPTQGPGVARWAGDGVPLAAALCRSIRAVLAGEDPAGLRLSRRATEVLARLRAEHPWARDGATALVRRPDGRVRWWTFAGSLANASLAGAVRSLRRERSSLDNLSVALDDGVGARELRAVLAGLGPEALPLGDLAVDEAVEALKFSECLPADLARLVVEARLDDRANAAVALCEPLVEAV